MSMMINRRPVIASRSLHRRAPLVRHSLVALVKQGYHLAHCPNSGTLSLLWNLYLSTAT